MQDTNVDGTVLFLSKFLEFWKILNVKGYEDIKQNDPLRSVISSVNDPKLLKLMEIANFARSLQPESTKREQSLTKDTSNAIFQTCHALIDLSKHLLLEHNFEYVVLGKFTSDPLEKSFGKLRQGSGGTYFINVQQVIEKVNIFKTKLLLQLNVDIEDYSVSSNHSCHKCGYFLSGKSLEIFQHLEDLEPSLSNDVKMSLIYIAGYIVRKEDPGNNDTFMYYDRFGTFLSGLNRGRLCIPPDTVCQWVMFSCILFLEVASDACRSSLSNLMMSISESYDFSMERKHGNSLSNIFLNNYCKLYTPVTEKEPKQKLLKLS